MTLQLLVPLRCFAALTFTETSYSVLISLMYSTSIENGGLGFSSFQIGSIMGMWGTQDIFAHGHLCTLHPAFFEEAKHFIPFLDRLSAPGLEELGLEFGVRARWSNAHFTAFQLRARTITQIQWLYSSLTSDDLRAAVCHASSLTRLKITSCEDCINDLNALCYKAGVSPTARFALDDIGSDFTEHALAGMIGSRW
ncbi:Major facilitator superfamily [Mycena sanguinolenta]|uniref:Major facilitator superfamily n=1 Tax=Mycena sanguinolenta TaxID=230812 RepID=A0A8H7CY03_9AGAR|nr:Major facilitator superfamily [Mycena sanguinolenta]